MAAAAPLSLAWDAVTSPEVAGYKVYYGNASQNYSTNVDVGNPTCSSFCTAALSGLDQPGLYYLAVTAYDVDGNESDFSNEVVYDPTQTAVAFAVNAGGAAYVATNGIVYQADSHFSGGDPTTTDAAIAGTTDDPLYQSRRVGDFSYTLPVANGDYVVTLKFADPIFTQPGQRVFKVLMQGVQAFSLDIVNQVGPNKAYDVTKVVHVSDGVLTINFQSVVESATVSAIVVEPATVVFAVNAGGKQYVDANGTVYQADGRFSGGTTHTTSAAIAGTKDPKLYQSERVGNFSYNIPVANGDYVVSLKFAEIDGTQVGQRVFNVLMEGVKVINNLDLAARVGANKAYNMTKTVHVSDGVLTIGFQPVVGNATVSAITVLQRGVTP